jgi:hypothetical protein
MEVMYSSIIPQKIELFINTAVSISNPTNFIQIRKEMSVMVSPIKSMHV